jgi:hypothetical protein
MVDVAAQPFVIPAPLASIVHLQVVFDGGAGLTGDTGHGRFPGPQFSINP